MQSSDLLSTTWCVHLRTHAPIARAGVDPEGIHQVRVALQRMRIWLRMHRKKRFARRLRDLRATLGAARDLDVLLLRDPPEPFAAWLRSQREALNLTPSLDVLPALADEVQALPGVPRPQAWAATADWAQDCLERAEALDPADDETFHTLRRRVRRVRYGLEWLGEDSEAVKRVQAVLGRMNDASVTLDHLTRWGGPAPEWADALEAELRSLRVEGQASWSRERSRFVEISALR